MVHFLDAFAGILVYDNDHLTIGIIDWFRINVIDRYIIGYKSQQAGDKINNQRSTDDDKI